MATLTASPPRSLIETPPFRVQFSAMASPCEILMDLEAGTHSHQSDLADAMIEEVKRIERKYSRYRDDNEWSELHAQPGRWQSLDDETARLIAFANEAFHLSDGRFDISSGLLRQAWRFDGSDRLPTPHHVAELLAHIGWQRVDWRPAQGNQPARLRLPAGMELDFGGIGKEYAVDRALGIGLTLARPGRSLLVNLGGDLAVGGPRLNGQPWWVALEPPDREDHPTGLIGLNQGALATSGDSHRFLLKDGLRYSHVLDPVTGWPVKNAPRSVSVAAPSCVQSGFIATLALLKGDKAESFLRRSALPYWIQQN